MKQLVFALFLTTLLALTTSCSKGDPNPEKKDEIYQDLLTELDIATKSLEAEEKNLINLQRELEKAVPQTGQIKFATKKVQASQAQIDVLTQQKRFFEIKLEMRKHYVQQRYQESLNKDGRPWPDQEELSLYKSIAKLNRDKLEYDRNKRMVKDKKEGDVPRGTKVESGGH